MHGRRQAFPLRAAQLHGCHVGCHAASANASAAERATRRQTTPLAPSKHSNTILSSLVYHPASNGRPDCRRARSVAKCLAGVRCMLRRSSGIDMGSRAPAMMCMPARRAGCERPPAATGQWAPVPEHPVSSLPSVSVRRYVCIGHAAGDAEVVRMRHDVTHGEVDFPEPWLKQLVIIWRVALLHSILVSFLMHARCSPLCTAWLLSARRLLCRGCCIRSRCFATVERCSPDSSGAPLPGTGSLVRALFCPDPLADPPSARSGLCLQRLKCRH